jgi:MutS domain I
VQLLHPTKVLLVKVGEFYETYGIDSVLLVQWCGLNPMGGKPKVYITTLDYTLHCTVYYTQTCDGERYHCCVAQPKLSDCAVLSCMRALRYQELLAVNQQDISSSAVCHCSHTYVTLLPLMYTCSMLVLSHH